MTENQLPTEALDEEETLEERQYHLASELRDRCIRKEFWASIMEGAEGFKEVSELDEYLDRMEAQFS
jgi:hypothetical protein